jgi:hypothetical protein
MKCHENPCSRVEASVAAIELAMDTVTRSPAENGRLGVNIRLNPSSLRDTSPGATPDHKPKTEKVSVETVARSMGAENVAEIGVDRSTATLFAVGEMDETSTSARTGCHVNRIASKIERRNVMVERGGEKQRPQVYLIQGYLRKGKNRP